MVTRRLCHLYTLIFIPLIFFLFFSFHPFISHYSSLSFHTVLYNKGKCLPSDLLSVPYLIIDEPFLSPSHSCPIINNISIAVSYEFRGNKQLLVEVGEARDKNVNISLFYWKKEKDYWSFEGDYETRRMTPFETLAYSHVSLPANMERFIREWRIGTSIECTYQRMNRTSPERKIPVTFIDEMRLLRDILFPFDAHLILAGGTLLGWYRECSFIPHTTDIDFFLLSSEYSPRLRSTLEGKRSPFHLFRVYGKPDDSYELSMTSKKNSKVNIDIFFLYTNENESWVGGLAWYERKKYKWTYPRIDELCTAILLETLFWIPCNVQQVLKEEYGEWQKDEDSNDFVWYKSHRNVKENGFYTKDEMKGMRAF